MSFLSTFHTRRSARFEFVYDVLIALAWTLLVGLPLFVVHMLLFDYEHFQHGMQVSFSLRMSLVDIFPRHPLSLTLWLSAVFITALSIRITLWRRKQLFAMREQLINSRTQALTDGLTGVWNRRGFDQLLQVALTSALQMKRPFSILLSDVDDLKQYNDKLGHPAADDALRTIASVLAAKVRSADTVARYGGDEFAIVCPDTDLKNAGRLVERLQSALASTPLTLSFGIASYPVDGNNPVNLVESADRRLYEAKAQYHLRQTLPGHDPDCRCNDCQCASTESQDKSLGKKQ